MTARPSPSLSLDRDQEGPRPSARRHWRLHLDCSRTYIGKLEVEGQVSVGPNGIIQGEVVADELVIGGKVEGKAIARAHLHVASGGSVRGEVRYGSLQIDRGGLIDGNTGHGHKAAASSSASADESEDDDSHAPPPPLPTRAGATVS